ncbi:MAG: type II secretion system protein [Planctomycetota bacterium]|nr:type II secretion system protein [Planctomycetota bacterium]
MSSGSSSHRHPRNPRNPRNPWNRRTPRITRTPLAPRRFGFTLIELLIVVSLIIVLISLIVVALTQSQRAAQRVNTQVLMNSMKQALVQFREDTGALPVVLDENRGLLNPPDISSPAALGNYDDDIQDWHSFTSMADFLIGYGDEQEDGYGRTLDGLNLERHPGIRDPGSDGVWGATVYGAADGSKGARNQQFGSGGLGKVLGPYLELGNPRLLVAVDNTFDPPRILFPGDVGYDTFPKAIADYWGNPIHYHRRAYPIGAPGQSFRPVDRDGDGIPDAVPSLSDVIVLRPQQAGEAAIVQTATAGQPLRTIGGATIDLTTYELQTGEFALFSAGPDRRFNRKIRVDDPTDPLNLAPATEFFNVDNIVEVGQ